MHELIPITTSRIGKHEVQACSARELHRFLKVGRDFTSWIKGRIWQYGYEEHKDYEELGVFPQTGENVPETGENSKGGRPAMDFLLTIDMAKELAMVEKNDIGRLARRYFIACEKAATRQVPALARELLRTRPLWGLIARYKGMGLNHVEIGKLTGLHRDTIRKHVRRMEQCGLVARRPHACSPQMTLPGMEAQFIAPGQGATR